MVFLFYCSGDHRDPLALTHPFPTRRYCDLAAAVRLPRGWSELPGLRWTRSRLVSAWTERFTTASPACAVPIAPTAIRRARITSRLAIRNCLHSRRSEEHTSELQSLMRISYAVFCLKKQKNNSM